MALRIRGDSDLAERVVEGVQRPQHGHRVLERSAILGVASDDEGAGGSRISHPIHDEAQLVLGLKQPRRDVGDDVVPGVGEHFAQLDGRDHSFVR